MRFRKSFRAAILVLSVIAIQLYVAIGQIDTAFVLQIYYLKRN